MKNHNLKILISALLLLQPLFLAAQTTQSTDPYKNPDNYISVDFDDASLKEVVFMISEFTGSAFVFTDLAEKRITWTQPDIYKQDIVSTFTEVISALGLTCQLVSGSQPFYLIKQDSLITDQGLDTSVGVYRLKNIGAEAVRDSGEILYGDKLSIAFNEDNRSIVYSGSTGLVRDFTFLLHRIDSPIDSDIISIHLKHISTRSALKALTDLKILEDNNFYPDYWNRSVIIRGTEHQQIVAKSAIAAMDQPQEGWIDQVEFVHTTEVKQAQEILSNLYGDLEIRAIGDNRILISGESTQVEKASVMLAKIDGTGLQVKVEAVIAYLTDREFKELGLRLSYERGDFFTAINDNILNSLITRNTGILIDYFSDIVGIKLAAEEGSGHGEIISSPVLTVLNGKKARIHVGQNVPYLSSANVDKNNGETTGTSIQRQDIGITFDIQPFIEPDGDFVQVKVDQVVSNVTDDSELSQDAVDIIVDKKEISSTVMVANGDTIFLGGLKTEENGTAQDTIPLLSDIPLLGKLFSYDVTQKEQRHLVVSLRVNVLGRET